jgi:hypothetical protein
MATAPQVSEQRLDIVEQRLDAIEGALEALITIATEGRFDRLRRSLAPGVADAAAALVDAMKTLETIRKENHAHPR